MKKLLKQTAVFAVVMGIATVIGADAFADEAGAGFLADFKTAIRGSIGTTGGLVVSLVGLYMWIWNQVSWGIIVAIGGALLTAFPDIYENIGSFGKDAFKGSIAKDAVTSTTKGSV
jgi:hypothetical protein